MSRACYRRDLRGCDVDRGCEVTASQAAWLTDPLRERITSLYGLCLAIQGTAPDVRTEPWFARWWRLASAELTALQARDVAQADRLLALRVSHEAML